MFDERHGVAPVTSTKRHEIGKLYVNKSVLKEKSALRKKPVNGGKRE